MSHPRTTIGLLVGLAVALGAAWSLGGARGNGVALGFLLGAVLIGFGLAWQGHWLRVAPSRAMRAQVEAFLLQLGLLVGFALAFRYVPVLGDRVDWREFLVAYAGAAALLIPLGTWETVRRGAGPRASGPAESRSAL